MHPLPIKYKFLLLIFGKKSTPAIYTGAWGEKQGRNWGRLRNAFICNQGGKMFLHLLMGRNLYKTQVLR